MLKGLRLSLRSATLLLITFGAGLGLFFKVRLPVNLGVILLQPLLITAIVSAILSSISVSADQHQMRKDYFRADRSVSRWPIFTFGLLVFLCANVVGVAVAIIVEMHINRPAELLVSIVGGMCGMIAWFNLAAISLSVLHLSARREIRNRILLLFAWVTAIFADFILTAILVATIAIPFSGHSTAPGAHLVGLGAIALAGTVGAFLTGMIVQFLFWRRLWSAMWTCTREISK